MRPFGDIISLDEARRRIDEAVQPIDRVDRVRLEEANGRVLAMTIFAPGDVPPFARAAMDGYAVRAHDTTGAARDAPRVLTRIETLYTGEVARRTVAAGECIEIATGAPMPPGADAVVIVEDTDGEASGAVQVFAAVSPGQNVGRQGADIRSGQVVLEAGTTLTPSRIGAVAALGLVDVPIFARPRVAILSTGNEIVDPGRPLAPGQIYDVNRFTLAAVVSQNGGEPVAYRAAGDTLDDLNRAIDEAHKEDVLVFSGGSSVGERDLILDVLAARGEVIFHGIAVKPGKPTLFARIARPAQLGGHQLVFGMPGNPTSCLSQAHVLLVPALRLLAGLPPLDPPRVRRRLAAAVGSPANRHQFLPVRIEGDLAVPTFKGSGEITSLSQADGYVEIPVGVARLEEGAEVEVVGYE
jgi:molybdopterin molybdotransferase